MCNNMKVKYSIPSSQNLSFIFLTHLSRYSGCTEHVLPPYFQYYELTIKAAVKT